MSQFMQFLAKRLCTCAAAFYFGLALAPTVSAQSVELTDPDPGINNFGYSVALSNDGNTALVSGPFTNAFAGAAYIFVKQGSAWTLQQELTASDSGTNRQFFGFVAALSGDGHTALVGAVAATDPNGTRSGAAYIFTKQGNTWTQQQKLTPTDAAPGDEFGYSVALNNDGRVALIGSIVHNGEGAAYVFAYHGNTWTQQQELLGSDGVPGTLGSFGSSVALNNDGHVALVGARLDDNLRGAAYVFGGDGNTWGLRQELTATDGAQNDNFGYSVALNNDGDTALIGSLGAASGHGAAYAFAAHSNTWTQQQELTASDGITGDGFGWSVSLNNDGHIALIGAPFRNGNRGAAYQFSMQANTWTKQQEFTASTAYAYGYSVTLNGEGHVALIGATGENSGNGSVYILGPH